jgi:hypothetical protein
VPLQGREIHPSPSRRPAITASVREMMRTQNIARGPVPWRISVVVLVGIRSVLVSRGLMRRTPNAARAFRCGVLRANEDRGFAA